MDILKTSTEWAKAELLSNAMFILAGVMFVAVSFGVSRMGKTDMARAFVTPTLVAGGLLLILGGGLLYGTWKSLAGFGTAVAHDPSAFVSGEIVRVESTLAQYAVAAFKVMPAIIFVCAALILVVNGPVWQASLITAIIMLAVIIAVDSTASARLAAYKDKLLMLSAAK
ncbi:hypothetical protein [Celeribacter sp. ULVN23_4]